MDNSLGQSPALEIGNRSFGTGLFLILGPCVIESEELTLSIARRIAEISRSTGIPAIFKASFDKANRTSIDSYRGPGMERGLQILALVKRETGLPLISDIHTPDQAVPAAAVLDVIQIPAFLSRQTDLLVAAGRTGRTINIKKGQFQSPEDMEHAINKVLSTGNSRIILTERGASFGYQDLVADMRSIVRMKGFGFPVVFDATHSSQFPGKGNGRSGGNRDFVSPLAMAAVAAGADGVFMETHPDPDNALCDGPNSLPLFQVEQLAVTLREIWKIAAANSAQPVRPVSEQVESHGPSLQEKLKKIRLIIFDVDGVLTDGRITFGSGQLEIKSFNVRDGHGIKIAKRCGLEIAFVTGRSSDVVSRRAQDLGIERLYQGMWDKRPALTELMEELKLSPDQVAVVGDDVVDIPLMRRVGVSFTVPEAPENVRSEVQVITRNNGGCGAAREIVEMILKAQDKWDSAMARYYE
ncbi:MAG: 3-deoxy-8-phosphooctulonate synthase [Desulfomonile tiedjei]|uniref:2-dehydro-3-deoxyphosphooctonate aldolase n=1 Tax=Desulfomonile tiedjei TaxID=2358 RepID=A0A9D6V295_9BACT|nr:3-deoxy-8-phosphooctulonate synthase [Desulfomonile tiedjei]